VRHFGLQMYKNYKILHYICYNLYFMQLMPKTTLIWVICQFRSILKIFFHKIGKKWAIILGKVGNIEYGKIEKFCGLLHWKKSDGNIEFNTDFFNIDNKTGSNGVPRGVGGWLLMMIGDAMTPFYCRCLTFFDITYLYHYFDRACFVGKCTQLKNCFLSILEYF